MTRTPRQGGSLDDKTRNASVRTGIHWTEAQEMEPVYETNTGATESVAESCGSCGAAITPQIASTIRRLLMSYQPHQRAALADLFGGTAPDMLCPGCFNVTTGEVNVRIATEARPHAG